MELVSNSNVPVPHTGAAVWFIYRRKTDTVSIGDWGSIAERHPSWE
jgi:hypothetical protein